MAPVLTRHGTPRCQQRAIPPFVRSVLLDHGRTIRSRGADVVFVDKVARKRITAVFGDRLSRVIEPYLDAYLVASDDGQIITAGWRISRIKHNTRRGRN